MPYCSNCTVEKAIWKCSRCLSVAYCSKKCQKEHWETLHKDECIFMTEELIGTRKRTSKPPRKKSKKMIATTSSSKPKEESESESESESEEQYTGGGLRPNQLWKTNTVTVNIMNFTGSENPEFDDTYPEFEVIRRAMEMKQNPLPEAIPMRKTFSINALRAPIEDELCVIASIGRPLVEIGAGKGYWARCLYNRGCDITAYDLLPAHDGFIPVCQGDAVESVLRNANRVLLVVWNSFPLGDTFRAYAKGGGDCVVYAGERPGLSTITRKDYRILTNELGFVFAFVLDIHKRMPERFVGGDVDCLYVMTTPAIRRKTKDAIKGNWYNLMKRAESNVMVRDVLQQTGGKIEKYISMEKRIERLMPDSPLLSENRKAKEEGSKSRTVLEQMYPPTSPSYSPMSPPYTPTSPTKKEQDE